MLFVLRLFKGNIQVNNKEKVNGLKCLGIPNPLLCFQHKSVEPLLPLISSAEKKGQFEVKSPRTQAKTTKNKWQSRNKGHMERQTCTLGTVHGAGALFSHNWKSSFINHSNVPNRSVFVLLPSIIERVFLFYFTPLNIWGQVNCLDSFNCLVRQK